MAKEKPNTKPKAVTPFRKFETLARKIVRVPKSEAAKVKRYRNRRGSSSSASKGSP